MEETLHEQDLCRHRPMGEGQAKPARFEMPHALLRFALLFSSKCFRVRLHLMVQQKKRKAGELFPDLTRLAVFALSRKETPI
jgi:hypothetical protein